MPDSWIKLADLPPSQITPMVRQYIEAKAECAGSLLFFRMGDFYELFFEDAVEAAGILGLALTSRDSADKAERIPMCGVPVRAVDSYVARAIKAGRTVTICDQVEDPRAAKGIVKRAVTRTITPGTIMEPALLEDTANNYLAALCVQGAAAGLAFCDVTTGELLAAQIDGGLERTLADELTRMAPVEALVPDAIGDGALARIERRFPGIVFTRRPEIEFERAHARDIIQDRFGLATLKGIGLDDAREAAGCVGALLCYVRETQRDAAPPLQPPRRYSPAGYVVIDGSTQRNLELVSSLADNSRRGTLLSVLDRTLTPMGARKLRHWILHPLLDVDEIRARLGAVEALFEGNERRMGLRDTLRRVGDLERLLGRIAAKSGNGRDVKALGRSLAQAPALREAIAGLDAPALDALHAAIDPLEDVAAWIEAAVVDEPPIGLSEGNLIKSGYDADLDRLHGLVRGGRDWIAALQAEERARTGISTLKVGYNKVFGYYIEISAGAAKHAPADYIRKQTLANAERFVTPALKEREDEILHAQERMQSLEYDLFCALRERIAAQGARIQATADAIAALDAWQSLAETAAARGYAKPEVDGGAEIRIDEGRHPVVEDLMQHGEFVPNDTLLDGESRSMLIVTGPNMAGKSTYLRQVALIALMAQMGGFVPAARARIGVVDRIFTRVGASDNLVRGESTFMVEMIETANILNAATSRSLLVLDEIGRGTSTFDGISIAWSVAEHLHDRIKAKTLFATHYHELTELGTKLERAQNVNVAVREYGDRVIFLYRISEGGADHSYGIQVAKLAGLPPSVILRAREILESLESGNQASVGLPEQMYLFGPGGPSEPTALERELEAIDPDKVSPRDAHDLLYRLKHLAARPRH